LSRYFVISSTKVDKGSEAILIQIHRVLAEYFIANDGIKRDITLHRRKLTVEKADRQVTKQPLIVKNKRKLTAVI
jgi:hypothetical protein